MRILAPQSLTLVVGESETGTALTLQGLRLSEFLVTNDGVETAGLDQQGWRRFLSRAGMRKISIEATGIFLDSEGERRVRSLALSGAEQGCEIRLQDGPALQGNFLVTRFGLKGSHGEEPAYSLRLESSGMIALL